MTRLAPALIAMLSVASLASSASAQRLGHVSGSVHGSGRVGSSHSFGSVGGGSYGRYQRYGYGSYGYPGGGAAAAPYDPLSERVQLPYPYALGYAGVRVDRRAETPDRPIASPSFLAMLDVTAGWVPDGIGRGNVALRLSVPGVVDIELSYGAYVEQVASSIDMIHLGRLGVALHVLDTDIAQMRLGIGTRVYADSVGPVGGGDGGLELDLYPGEPTRLSLDARAGVLGSAWLFDGRASFGVQIDRGELYVGYQVLAIVPVNGAGGDVLHGPILGMRVWIS